MSERSVVGQARRVLDEHLRGIDGRCSCGARNECRAYERAQEALAARRQLPRRRPGAAQRDLIERRGLGRDAAE